MGTGDPEASFFLFEPILEGTKATERGLGSFPPPSLQRESSSPFPRFLGGGLLPRRVETGFFFRPTRGISSAMRCNEKEINRVKPTRVF